MDRYFNTKILLDSMKKKRYRQVSFIPTLEKTADDIYVIASVEDRLDNLAYRYYGDPLAWFIIACANPGIVFDSFYIEPGTQLRIPSKTTANSILEMIINQNKNK